MTTPNIRERVRALQESHYAESEVNEGSKAREIAARLYDEIDALSAQQRALLVTESAGLAKGALSSILSSKDPSQVYAMAMIALGLLGVTCYSNEQNREDAGDTINGDRRVDDVLDTVREMVHEQTGDLLSPEQKALAEKISAEIEARVNDGADRMEATRTVLAEHQHEIDRDVRKTTGAEVPSRYDDAGMYL